MIRFLNLTFQMRKAISCAGSGNTSSCFAIFSALQVLKFEEHFLMFVFNAFLLSFTYYRVSLYK